MKHIAFKDIEELVNKYDLEKWKECVALIFSQSSSSKRNALLNLLAERILNEFSTEEDQQPAIYCYILAEEFNKIVDIYHRKIVSLKQNTRSRKLKLSNLGTRLLAIYSTLKTEVPISSTFERLIR